MKGGLYLSFLYVLESIRTPFLDVFMSLITRLGEETVFLAVAIAVFWCVNKYEGYYLMSVGLVGTVINQFMKIIFRIARPWVLNPEFTIVESAREAATGYSFPSGHTQSAVSTFGGLAWWNKRLWVRVLCLIPVVLVPLSRMYLGVHTPLDVGVSFAVSLLLIFGMYPVIKHIQQKPSHMGWLLGVMLTLAFGFVLFMELYAFPADVDAANLASAHKNAYTLCGSLLGIVPVWYLDNRYIRFETKAVWWAQLLKLIPGLLLVVGVKALLKAPLLALCGGHDVAHLIRYFLVVVTAGTVWPLTFRFFSRLGTPKEH